MRTTPSQDRTSVGSCRDGSRRRLPGAVGWDSAWRSPAWWPWPWERCRWESTGRHEWRPLGVSTFETTPIAAPASTEIVVDVAGAVVRPGLHRLRHGDRVGDAIEAAGGFAPRADLTASSQSLNLAQPLEDGSKVLVPELGVDRPSARAAARDDGRIDLNRASQSELETLPGIGPVTAGKIIDTRADDRFDAVRELRSRGIVGEKVYEDIKGLVSAG